MELLKPTNQLRIKILIIRIYLVMGPWPHGGWTRLEGDSFGDMEFGSKTSEYYIEQIELPFFNYYLKNKGEFNLPEAYIFNTGKNTWQKFNEVSTVRIN